MMKFGFGPQALNAVAETLNTATRDGRSVVMLVGAGLSVDAGIPLGGQLTKYLVRVARWAEWHQDQQHRPTRSDPFCPPSVVRQVLLDLSWPSRHDIAIDLMVAHDVKRLKELDDLTEYRLARAMFIDELRHRHPTVAAAFEKNFDNESPFATRVAPGTAYRSLLNFLTNSDQSLIDACLDHFIRDREPTTIHQLLVFLARDLGVATFLTTNFDPLLEYALATEHRVVTTYPILGPDTIPAARLVARQPCAVIKLHGATHHIQIGLDLDQPMAPRALEAFMEVFNEVGAGRPPLLFVFGYSGRDGRVMSLVNEHVLRATRRSPSHPAVVWVSQTEEGPRFLHGAEKNALVVHYPDGRLFLQHLYLRRCGQFPVARSHYQAVAFAPRTPLGDGFPIDDTVGKQYSGLDWRVGLVRGQPHAGTSSTVARIAAAAEKEGKRVIWIDLAEIRTVSTLAEILTELFIKSDARLAALWRPLMLDATLRTMSLGLQQAQAATLRDTKTFVRWIQHALRRGNYLLVLDSLEEFARFHPAVSDLDSLEGWPDIERHRLILVLNEVCRSKDLIGDSQIVVASSFNDGDISPAEQLLHSRMWANALGADIRPSEPETGTASLPGDPAALCYVRSLLAACRRPIPIPAFSGLLNDGPSLPALCSVFGDSLAFDIERNVAVNEHLNELVHRKLISPAPGGGYWVHSDVRRRWYEALGSERAVLHDCLAHYYWKDVYQRSRDVRAFLEYLFHRIAHLRHERERERFLNRLERVAASLDNELELLLARGRIPSLLFLLRQFWAVVECRDDIQELNPVDAATVNRCYDTFLRAEAEMLMASGHGHSALDIQILRLRLYANGSLPRPDNDRSTARIKTLLAQIEDRERAESNGGFSLKFASLRADVAHALQAPFEWADDAIFARRWTGLAKIDRAGYLALAVQIYESTTAIAGAPSVQHSELLMRIARRQAELMLKIKLPGRFLPMVSRVNGVLLRTSRPVSRLTAADRARLLEDIDSKLNACLHVELTRRLRRQRCYLTTLKAVTLHFGKVPLDWHSMDPLAVDYDHDRLLEHEIGLLNEAESHLVRDDGDAERQALAVLRLTGAMLLVEHAELMLVALLEAPDKTPSVRDRPNGSQRWTDSHRHWRSTPSGTRSVPDQLPVLLHALSRAELNLNEAKSLMAKGRGEVRWRQLYTLYSARYWLLHARTPDPARPINWRRESLLKAGQSLASGLTSTGRMTDRWVVMAQWWKQIEDEWRETPAKVDYLRERLGWTNQDFRELEAEFKRDSAKNAESASEQDATGGFDEQVSDAGAGPSLAGV